MENFKIEKNTESILNMLLSEEVLKKDWYNLLDNRWDNIQIKFIILKSPVLHR